MPWVFHRNGQRILYYYNAWREACTKAGCPGRYVHDLRRTAVRNLERAGVPRSVAMKLTGHKTEAVYRRYAIVAEGDLREGVAKLATLRDRRASRLSEPATGVFHTAEKQQPPTAGPRFLVGSVSANRAPQP